MTTEEGKAMVIFQPSGSRGLIAKGMTIKEASVALGVDIEGVCGEKAICGTCKVRIEEGDFEKYNVKSSKANVSSMSPTERKFFNISQEQAGYRLACQTLIQGDIVVFVPEESRMGKQVVRKEATDRPMKVNPAVRKYTTRLTKASLHDSLGDWERLTDALEKEYGLKNLTIDYMTLMELQKAIREGDWQVTVTVWHNREIIKVEPGRVTDCYGLAVDVGTSTIAGYLCDLNNGKVVTTASMMNPQVVYGEDVMSRISYTMVTPKGLEILNKAILDGLNGLIEDVCAQMNIRHGDIVDMSIVGNTCMHHIYLNIDPKHIGRAPFAPALHHSLDIKAREFGSVVPPEPERVRIGTAPPCQVECPAGVNAQDFLYLLAQGNYAGSLDVVRLAMPFAGLCGRVCTHPCEAGCERGRVDDPLSIRALHRFLADVELSKDRPKAEPVKMIHEEKIAVVGAGPSGLACAYDLVRNGYGVTVYEAQPEAGGLMRYGIPDYRLPKTILNAEISYLEELGVNIQTGSRIKDLENLFVQGFRAVYLSTGAWQSQKLDIPGEEAGGVLYALDFLNRVNWGQPVEIGKKVAVIGGGSVAVDAARLALRLGAEEVHLVCLESRDLTCPHRLPAQDLEIQEAELEGVIIHPDLGVGKIIVREGRVAGLDTLACVSVFDDDGRFAPKFADSPAPTIEADTVIVAIGQKPDGEGFPAIRRTGQTFQSDPRTFETNIPGVFAGGDGVTGPSNIIKAIAAGKEAAISIELYLAARDVKTARPAGLLRVEDIPKEGVRREARQPVPTLPADQRRGMEEVELTYEESAAMAEARRCLHCSVYAQKEISEGTETRELGLHISQGAYVHVLPIEAGFVGADNVGVLIAEEPYNQEALELIIDIGTNGELILGNRQRLLSASCATGPAFEGAEIKFGMRAAPGAIERIKIDPETKEPRFKVIGHEAWNTESTEIKAKGICGSGIIDGIAQLFLAGIIDRSGRFDKTIDNPRLRMEGKKFEYVIAWADQTSIGKDVVIHQDDVRAIQLGKAAMHTGAKIMMRDYGVDKVDKVILAGAFGSYIDKVSAAVLGMFPDCPQDKIYSVGNAAGDGARMALLDVDKRLEADEYARKVDYKELTVEKDFQKLFMDALALPHKKDPYPGLKGIIPADLLPPGS
jgi:uncharacterized 2Fe-2S/4Fe-4S cluster protein (DUF4445 family)/NADPH-dependent glutamate synthase beta subunit-like oxidoreductase